MHTPEVLSLKLRAGETAALRSVLRTVERCSGNLGRTADELGVPRRTFSRWVASMPALADGIRELRRKLAESGQLDPLTALGSRSPRARYA